MSTPPPLLQRTLSELRTEPESDHSDSDDTETTHMGDSFLSVTSADVQQRDNGEYLKGEPEVEVPDPSVSITEQKADIVNKIRVLTAESNLSSYGEEIIRIMESDNKYEENSKEETSSDEEDEIPPLEPCSDEEDDDDEMPPLIDIDFKDSAQPRKEETSSTQEILVESTAASTATATTETKASDDLLATILTKAQERMSQQRKAQEEEERRRKTLVSSLLQKPTPVVTEKPFPVSIDTSICGDQKQCPVVSGTSCHIPKVQTPTPKKSDSWIDTWEDFKHKHYRQAWIWAFTAAGIAWCISKILSSEE